MPPALDGTEVLPACYLNNNYIFLQQVNPNLIAGKCCG